MKILVAYRDVPEKRLERLRRIAPGHQIVAVEFPRRGGDRTPPPEMVEHLADAHVFFGYFLPPNLLDLAPNLRWIQVPAAGVDRYLSPQLRTAKLTITNASGSSAAAIAEYVIGGMLWFVKRLPEFEARRREHRYRRTRPGTLEGKTLGVVGLGAIGQETARLAKAFRMRVLAMRRHWQPDAPPDVDHLFPREELVEMLRQCDYVCLSVPLTDETRSLIDARALAAMRPHAILINVARGGVVDEPALIDALRERRIGGAVLDVFAQEPLPPDSPLWDLDNVLLTPHVSGEVEDYADRIFAIFEENLRRFLSGHPLENVVDVELGY